MENVVFTQLSIPEVRRLLREELEGYFATNATGPGQPLNAETDALLTIQEAADYLHLTVPTLYSKVHARELPFSKRGKRLYFSKAELADWVKGGRRKTVAEIKAEAAEHIANGKKKGGSNV